MRLLKHKWSRNESLQNRAEEAVERMARMASSTKPGTWSFSARMPAVESYSLVQRLFHNHVATRVYMQLTRCRSVRYISNRNRMRLRISRYFKARSVIEGCGPSGCSPQNRKFGPYRNANPNAVTCQTIVFDRQNHRSLPSKGLRRDPFQYSCESKPGY